MEDIRQGAPAAVPGEHSFFGCRPLAAFVFNEPQRADGGDVIAGLFLQPALPDPVRFGYPEVARRRRGRRLLLDVDEEASGGGSSFCGSVHSCAASSHAS